MTATRIVRAPKNRIVREGTPTKVRIKPDQSLDWFKVGKVYDIVGLDGEYYRIVDEDGDLATSDPSRWVVVSRSRIGYVVVKFAADLWRTGLEVGGEYPVQAETKTHVDVQLRNDRVVRVKKKRLTSIHSNPQAATDEYLAWKSKRERSAAQQKAAEGRRKAAADTVRETCVTSTKTPPYPVFRIPFNLSFLDAVLKADKQSYQTLQPVAKLPALTIGIPEGKTKVTIRQGVHDEIQVEFA